MNEILVKSLPDFCVREYDCECLSKNNHSDSNYQMKLCVLYCVKYNYAVNDYKGFEEDAEEDWCIQANEIYTQTFPKIYYSCMLKKGFKTCKKNTLNTDTQSLSNLQYDCKLFDIYKKYFVMFLKKKGFLVNTSS